MTIKTDRRGKAIYYTGACPERSRGNNLDRLIRKQYSGVSGLLSYTYDLNSRLTQVSGALANGTYTFTYDRMGRLTGTTTAYPFLTGRTFTNAYAYDAASNRTSFTDPENGVTTYAYDNLNRLTSLTDFNSNQFGFTYDALSRRTQLSRPNGVNTDYAYDAVGNRLSDLTTANWTKKPNECSDKRRDACMTQYFVEKGICWNVYAGGPGYSECIAAAGARLQMSS